MPLRSATGFLLAASFVLVGFLSVKTQEFAREAGASTGRMRQIEIEKALREATGRVRGTLNVELVQRAVVRESIGLVDAARAMLVVRETAFALPLMLSYRKGDVGHYGGAPGANDGDGIAGNARRRDGGRRPH